MPEPISLNKLQQNLVFFNKMYDAVRLVDPVRKRVLEYRDCMIGKTAEICYAYWENGHICDNCISVRAHHDNKSYIKLEQNPDVIMLVTALPIENAEEPVILELLKDATDSMMVGAGDYNDGQAMRSVVTNINNMVIKDPLTSLYNRRFLDDRLPVDIVKATVARQPLSVIFLDVDNLKAINDTYGHTAGDLALRHVSDAIQKDIRADMDWAARYGGDEFFICLTSIGYDDACQIAERIRSNIAGVDIPIQDKGIKITASLGIQTMWESALTAEEIIRLADEKMYKAKQSDKTLPAKRILAFGDLTVYGDAADKAVRWPTAKVRELFSCFVLNRGEALGKWQLCERLWPQSSPKKAEHSLHSAVNMMKVSLREAGISNALRCEQGKYHIDLSGFSCDVWELQTFIESNPLVNEENIASFEKILPLYQEDLFGTADYAWCIEFREKLRALYLAGVKSVGRYFLAQKNYGRAEELLQKVVQADPYDEDAVSLLLKVYFFTGSQEKFVRCFENLKLTLKEELGVAPKAETASIYTDLLQRL